MTERQSEKLYSGKLAKEWVDWVETPDPKGTREKEIFLYIKRWLKQFQQKTVIDIGCGQGAVSELFYEKINYIGIDPSEDLIKRAKKKYESLNRKFVIGSAYELPLDSNSADGAMSIWVWSHLENLKSASEEMFRVLKQNGRFLIITASPDTYEERKTFYKSYKIHGNKLVGTFDLGNGKALSDTTLYLHTKRDMKESITKAGLIIEKIEKLGQAETSDLGLYIVIEGYKKVNT
jgi:ubiquinone/menaquinone biosynthesis C-methylase UbiE